MRLIALLPFVFYACASFAEAAEVTVDIREIKGKTASGEAYAKGQMTTPLVKAKKASDPAAVKIAEKINDRLSFIDLQGTESQQFTVTRNDGRMLTISFEGEGCGAYCENYRTWYSFDLRDGSLMTPANLFTPNGMRALAVRLRQTQITRYREQLTELAKSLKATQPKPASQPSKADTAQQEIIDDLQARIALNKSCLNDKIDQAKESANQQVPSLFSYPGNLPFEMTDKAFKLTAGRCSNHASRALDDVGDVVLSLPYRELAAWLTGYGKAALLNDGSALPAERVYGQVLYGTLNTNASTANAVAVVTTAAIATIPITMLIEKGEENRLSGAYFYDRFRQPIGLTGSLTGQTLDLKESSAPRPGEPAGDATFRLTRTGHELRGQWSNKAANKAFEVRIAP